VARLAEPEVVDLVLAAAPAVLELFELVERFFHSAEGMAITDYWDAFDRLQGQPDWVVDASRELIADVDTLLMAAGDRLRQLSRHYVDTGPITDHGEAVLRETVARLRGTAAPESSASDGMPS